MTNITIWQERGFNLLATKYVSKNILNVLTEVHFIHFATFQQSEHKHQILDREVTSCLKPIEHSQREEICLNISLKANVHVCSTNQRDYSEGIFVIKYVIYGSNHLTIKTILLEARIFARIRCLYITHY